VDAGRRRSAFYTKVPAGRYRFEVQAREAEGPWNGGAAVAVEVGPYFRETIWFRLLTIAIVLALVVAGTLWRTRHLAARQRELEGEVADRTVSLRREKVRAEEALAKVEEQNQALAMLDKIKTRFFADASHELRTPLTLIIGPLSDLLDEKHGQVNALVRQPLSVMKRNALRLHRLVNQMLDLHRLESGGLRLDRATRDLRPFVQDVGSAFLPLAERQRIQLDLEISPEACPVSFDSDQMEKVVANLLSNAMKFVPSGGRIQVEVRPDADSVLLAVTDDGAGIPPEEIPYVLDRFYRGTNVSQVREGTGIGLALVQELVQRHGGTIELHSRPHVETTFTVRLPRSDQAELTSETVVASEGSLVEWVGLDEPLAAHQPDDTTTILVVDDNSDVRNYIAGILEPHYRVVAAGDGQQALEKAAEELPDLIISDILMPNLDGLALCRTLRANPETECIPVILLTALADTPDEVAGIETGADEYLVKPFSSDALLARVDGLLAQRHRLRVRMRTELIQESLHRTEAPAAGGLRARGRAFILEHLHDDHLTVERLAGELAMSRSTLHRALQDEGTTPSELLRVTRLERAAELLVARAGNVSEIAYAVGFQSLAHFSRSFRDQFGIPPSGYASLQLI
jgi:signal transduction histidine kinase/DNA-binding response OmpR family regulator